MTSSFLEWPVRKQLALETNTLNKVRIRVLAYALHLRIASTFLLLIFDLVNGETMQAKKVTVLLLISVLVYVALALGLNWRKAMHCSILIFSGIVWTNLLILDHAVTVVTLQYTAIVGIAAFYGLGASWGFLYSSLAVLAYMVFFSAGHTLGPHIPLGSAGVGTTAIGLLLLHDFMFLVLIHYYFFDSFNQTIKTLDARSAELILNLKAQEASQKRQLEEFVHQKHLLASISHDIKSPLRFLMITTNRLATTHPDLPTVRAISQSSYRLYNFMKNLLEYTEFRYKNAGIQFAFLDLHELVEQKFEIFATQADSNANKLINDVEPGTILKSNQQLIGIILHNLIDNANKVTHQGKVIVKCEDYRNEVRVTVRDTGQGMDAGIMNWINSKHKIPGPEHNPQSFGMGLLIVKEISESIRVRLLAEPFRPQGTSIHIIFSKNNAGS